MSSSLHEDLARQPEIAGSSARSFGLWFALAFTVIGVLPLRSRAGVRSWALIVAAAFLLLALIAPAVLQPLNALWMKIGLGLAKVMNPVVMAVVFFGVFTPMAWILRKSGRDLLRLKLDPGASSYWIPRNPPGPTAESMSTQF